jgi:hypothetical protein
MLFYTALSVDRMVMWWWSVFSESGPRCLNEVVSSEAGEVNLFTLGDGSVAGAVQGA